VILLCGYDDTEAVVCRNIVWVMLSVYTCSRAQK
jgi:hypothetical protein